MVNQRSFDLIVLGAGSMGAAASYFASQRGLSCLCIEQFALGHFLGSAHGHTRVFRKAYFEKSDYVPFCRRSHELWNNLEAASGERLLFLTGILLSLPRQQSAIESGLLESANKYAIPLEKLTMSEAKYRWPVFNLRENSQVFFEQEAGYLLVEKCVEQFIKLAKRGACKFNENETVVGWTQNDGSVQVQTNQGSYTSAKLLIAGGAWNSILLSKVGIDLHPHRVQTSWFPSKDPRDEKKLKDCPTWMTEEDGRIVYGFPMLDRWGVKAADHLPGPRIDNLEEIDRRIVNKDAEKLGVFVNHFIPSLSQFATKSSVCLYSMSHDEDFILDFVPGSQKNIAFAAGFSGHGFKFAPAIGEHMVEFLFDEKTFLDSRFLRIRKTS